MKYSNPGKLAISISILVTALFAILYFATTYLFFNISLLRIFISLFILGIVIFFSTYSIFKYSLENFIYERIKVIYKSIYTLKSRQYKKPDFKKDIFEKINSEVIEWGENKKEEIEQLRKLEEYRREYIGNISHELKTPIFNIQGYISTLLEGGLEDKTINRDYLLRAEKSIDRMIAIVEDLELLSKFESGQIKLKMGRYDIIKLTKGIIESLEVKAKKSGYELNLSTAYDNSIFVETDKERIEQVLINLIDNSIKYGAEQNGKTKISFFDMDELVLVEITDNGGGIFAEDIPRLFDRFFRTERGRTRQQKGTGLGLAIVKHIIDAHNQTINVRSSIGMGTTFAFTLKKA